MSRPRWCEVLVEGSLWLGILFAIIASTNMNVGKAIQKWKVKVFGHGRKMFRRAHRKDLGVWGIGFLLTSSATIFYSLALKFTDKSSMVSSLTGIGLIGLVLFAWLVLKEKVGKQEIGGAALVLLGTAIMGLFESSPEAQEPYLLGFLICGGIILVLLVPPVFWSWRTRRYHGLTFGALAGALLGIAVILGDFALLSAENSFFGQLRYPYPYFAVFSGTIAIVVTQLAFWRGAAMVVVPTINSVMILSPVVLEYFAFGTVLSPVSYLGIVAIVAGVVFLTATERKETRKVVGPTTDSGLSRQPPGR